MPRAYKDTRSGAILFTPTPDEELVLNLKATVASQSKTLERLAELIPLLGDPTIKAAIKNAVGQKIDTQEGTQTVYADKKKTDSGG